MDPINFSALLTPKGQAVLEVASALKPFEKDFLSHFQFLSKKFPKELARTALSIAILRFEAEKKFPQAGELYFTREALEQATSWEVASYRAKRYAPFKQVLDLGCSVGSDSLTMAEHAKVTGIDLDPLRIAMANANANALNAPANFIQADLHHLPLDISKIAKTAAFFDPARRKNYRRVFNVEDYNPPLSIIKGWLPKIPALGVKIAPGVNYDQLREYDYEIEFISLKGELKEAVLWFGPLKLTQRRATLLPSGHSLTSEGPPPEIPLSNPKTYIFEPDPAILRAGLVTTVASQLNAEMLDPEIAYLTADKLTETPFARVWEVEDWLPFNLKKLRAYLRERNVGPLTVKKRRSPILPEDLIKDLNLKGDVEKVLFLTKIEEKPIVIVAKPEHK